MFKKYKTDVPNMISTALILTWFALARRLHCNNFVHSPVVLNKKHETGTIILK